VKSLVVLVNLEVLLNPDYLEVKNLEDQLHLEHPFDLVYP
jgi:hypothetical protein